MNLHFRSSAHYRNAAGAGLICVAMLFSNANARAQATARAVIETGADYSHLTNGYPDWAGAYARFTLRPSPRNSWGLEIARRREFGETGTYFAVSDAFIINDDWYLNAAVGSSSGGFFYPRFRADAQLNKKWTSKRNLVTTIGGGYFEAKDVHRDASLLVGAVYYFEQPWVVQGGIRWNRSSPGSVISQSQFIAVSEGRDGRHFLVLRLGFGNEAYQAIGPATALVDFPSHSVTGTWRQWLGPTWGINSSAEYYKSRVYQRTGATVGIFKAF